MRLFMILDELKQKFAALYPDPGMQEHVAFQFLEELLQTDRAHLVAMTDIPFSPEQEQTLQEWVRRHTQLHEPVQYILGHVPFLTVDILVRPPVLIPRQETEDWVSDLIDQLEAVRHEFLTILDLCTGSGCVALALARAFNHAQVTGSDISSQALELAQENALHNGILNISFTHSDLFAAIAPHSYDLIVANPPYIAQEERLELDQSVRLWEDAQALYAPDHGLAYIKKIIDGAGQFLKPDSIVQQRNIPQVWIEIGYAQGPHALAYMRAAGYSQVALRKDLAGHDRVIVGTPPR